ncbi:hypothetical protein LJC01_00710 [Clostridiaceae bacterium OttesenSCG-928-D20]|nr:hypothetical protein [Clostridiaceae bacterium OttesenSCG-928-D20]
MGKLFTVALCNCERIFLRLLNERILFRGGAAYGDAYVDPQRSMLFGNAVNRAYALESKVAVHPRIVIEDFIAETVNENIETVKDKMIAHDPRYAAYLAAGLMLRMPETGDGIVEQDIDGNYVLNYLHSPENNTIWPNYYLSCYDFLKELIEYCSEQIDLNKDYKVIDKYYYLRRFTEAKLESLLELDSIL